MEKEKQNKYDHAIDLLRVVSILAVVMIHTTTRTIEASKFDLQRVPWTLFLNQISRFAVPLFFMLSGYVLELNYPFHANYFKYLKKRITRILVPYVFWSGIYYYLVYRQHTMGYVQAMFQGDASYQLYFVPALLIFYMIFPLIHKFYKVICNKWALVILGLLELYILFQDYNNRPIFAFYPLRIACLNYYIFLLGVVASHHKDRLILFINKWRIILASVTIIFGSYVFYEGFNLYMKTHNYLYFYSQWRISILAYTILLTATIYIFFHNHIAKFSLVQKFSRLTFFVFFIHVIVLETLWQILGVPLFHLNNKIAEQIWYDPLFFILVAGTSYLIAYIAHKIPRLSKITG